MVSVVSSSFFLFLFFFFSFAHLCISLFVCNHNSVKKQTVYNGMNRYWLFPRKHSLKQSQFKSGS